MKTQPICTVDAIRALEKSELHGDRPRPLMELAGAAAAGQARLLSPRTIDPVVVFCGPGNNGGDGFVVARHLRGWGHDVRVVSVADPDQMPPDARAAYDRFVDSGGDAIAESPPLADCGLVVDALFGIGMSRPIAGVYAEWIAAINRADCPVLALDVPSGVDADTGAANSHGSSIKATHTATFIALKPGLLTGDGIDAAGKVTLHDLGIDAGSAPDAGRWITWPVAKHWRIRRGSNTHKGTFGTVGIIGGASGMVGAPLLAARAALATGAGRVMLGFAGEQAIVVDVGQPELMIKDADDLLRGEATVLLVGPGLGQSRKSADLLSRALHKPVPIVLDADALNLIAVEPALAHRVAHREYPTVMTPHPAEAARLLQTSTPIIQSERLSAARNLAARYRCNVALKGAGTVCVMADGQWSINGTGNPGLATAGSGDVLSGVVAALLGQGIAPDRALLLGVCVHAKAAEVLVARGIGIGPIGMVAGELIPAVRELLNQ